MNHGTEFIAVLSVMLILLFGASIRYMCKWILLPYTLAMLFLGMACAFAVENYGGVDGLFGLFHLQEAVPLISSKMIIFIFLPALVFEGAFTLNPNVFRRSLAFHVQLLA